MLARSPPDSERRAGREVGSRWPLSRRDVPPAGTRCSRSGAAHRAVRREHHPTRHPVHAQHESLHTARAPRRSRVSTRRAGRTKLVIFNGHGGNDFKAMIRELQPRTRVFLCTLNWWQVVDGRDFFTDLGDHAGELETSVMQQIVPQLVRPLSEAGDGHAKQWRIAAFRDGWAWAPRQWTKVTADTGIGDPKHASAERGERFIDAVCERVAGFLVELAAADTDDLYSPTGPHLQPSPRTRCTASRSSACSTRWSSTWAGRRWRTRCASPASPAIPTSRRA